MKHFLRSFFHTIGYAFVCAYFFGLIFINAYTLVAITRTGKPSLGIGAFMVLFTIAMVSLAATTSDAMWRRLDELNPDRPDLNGFWKRNR
jgi:hypothetical protein